MMKFSIVIICRNQRGLISRCLNSVLDQTYENTEIIWVDDGSTDGSAQELERRAEGRFTLLCNENCLGIVASRLRGLDAATGDYLLFLDGDDELETNCCEVLAGVLGQEKYDVVGFGTNIVFDRPCTEWFRRDAENYMKQSPGAVRGAEVLEACYLKRDITSTIWNKCYSMELARRTSAQLERRFITLGEDTYITFVALSLADSFLCIEDRLYIYHQCLGISTSTLPSMNTFSTNLSAETVYVLCCEYAKKKGIYDKYAECLAARERDFIFGAFSKLKFFSEPERTQAAGMLLETYGAKKVLDTLAGAFWLNGSFAASDINASALLPVKRDRVRTVGMYYTRLYNGGTERVMSLLSELLSAAGYKIVVITQEEPNEKDYPLPEGAVRLVIGRQPYDAREIAERSARWAEFIQTYEIDAVIYNHWISPSLFWDLCSVKMTGAAFISYCHGSFVSCLPSGHTLVMDSESSVRQSDAVAVLTEADRLYWRRLNRRVYRVINPMTMPPDTVEPAALEKNNILWLGRLSDSQKNPEDALLILKRVLDSVPEATLTMVGEASEEAAASLRQKAEELGISDSVSMPGFRTDVADYYANASVFLLTSDFEGFPMVIGESLSAGVPIVMYELPYLTMVKNSGAILQVRHKDTEAAADAVSSLLLDGEKRRVMGSAARSEAQAFEAEDTSGKWTEILNAAIGHAAEEEFSVGVDVFNDFVFMAQLTFRQMCVTMARYNKEKNDAWIHSGKEAEKVCENAGKAVEQARLEAYYASEESALAERRKIYGSLRYRIGNVIMFLPSRIASFIKKLLRRG